MILEFNKYTNKYLFVHNDTPDGDVYYCDCDEIFVQNTNDDEETKKELTETGSRIKSMSMDDEMMNDFNNIYKGVKLATESEVRCPACNRNFQASFDKENFVANHVPFLSGFSFREIDDSVMLFYSVIKPDLVSLKQKDYSEEFKFIRLEKSTKKLFFKDFSEEEVEFDLDEVIKYVNKFFVFETNKVINLIDMHLFIGRLANFIMDAKNINIINDLLSDLHGKMDAGLDVIKKIVTIFFGIIKYSNLSTIAMTKSSLFLYDLMNECKIPKSQILIENNITSPIKIFNFLIQNYINKLNEVVNADNKLIHEFTYRSKKRINYDDNGENVNVEDLADETVMKIKVSSDNGYQAGKTKKHKGQYQVEDAVKDGSVSKFIFNKIKNFSDYKKIIKYFKLVEKKDLILLLQRYDMDFLLASIDLIYFRKPVSFKELERLLDIMVDHSRVMSIKNCMYMDGIVRMDYSYVKNFDFIIYDDALMMMEVLKFDPKVHFNKIKKWQELKDYHDNLVKYFSVLKDEEKNGSIMDFVSKFRFLEDKKDYTGPLEIKLLSTPGMIINDGIDMRHSGAAYATTVAQGIYLMGQVYDKDPERTNDEPPRYTIGFNYDRLAGLEFDQVKGFANELGEGTPKKTDRFKNFMMEWLTIKDISFRPIGDLKLMGNIDYDTQL